MFLSRVYETAAKQAELGENIAAVYAKSLCDYAKDTVEYAKKYVLRNWLLKMQKLRKVRFFGYSKCAYLKNPRPYSSVHT